MTIYVDDHRHLVCAPYTRANLHRAADLIGIRRCWFHARPYPHYDLPKRLADASAVELALLIDARMLDLEDDGHTYEAVEVRRVSPRDLLRVIKENRC